MGAPLLYVAGALAGSGALQSAIGRDRDEDDSRPALTGADPRVKAMRERFGAPALPDDHVLRQGSAPASTERSALDYVRDTAVDTAAAIPGTVQGLAGLANLPFAAAGAAPFEGVERYAGELKHTMLDRGLSEGRQAAERSYEQAASSADGEGFWAEAGAGAKALASHPSVAVGKIPQVLADVFVGAKGAGSIKSLGAVGRAAVGEGSMAAGQISAEIGAQTDDETRRLLAIPAGIIDGAIAAGGGAIISRMAAKTGTGLIPRTARFLNAADADVLLAGGVRSADNTAGLGRRLAGGAVREGLIEEAPQSAQETILTNIALGKPWDEGVGRAVGEGAVLGGAIGAGFNVPRGGVTLDGATQPDAPAQEGPGTPTPDNLEAGTDITESTPPVVSTVGETTTLKNPGWVSAEKWAVVHEAAAEVQTKEEAVVLFKKSKGTGKAADKAMRESAWYKGLPEKPAETSEAAEAEDDAYAAEFDKIMGGFEADPEGAIDALATPPEEETTGDKPKVTAGDVSLNEQEPPAYAAAQSAHEAVREQFLDILPEDATAREVLEAIEDFEPQYRSVIRALDKAQWLGFDYPSQAISAVFSAENRNFDLGPGLKSAVGRLVNRGLQRISLSEEGTATEPGTAEDAPKKVKLKGRTMGGLYAAISGYVDASGFGEVSIDGTKDGPKRKDNRRWRLMAKRSGEALASKPSALVDGTGVDLLAAIHNKTKRVEVLANLSSATERGITFRVDAQGNRQILQHKPDFAEDGTPISEAERRAEVAQERAEYTALAQDTTENLPPGTTPVGQTGSEAVINELVTEYESEAKLLESYFKELESMVGRKELRLAMTAGKYYTHNVTKQVMPGSKLNSETSEAVRFGMLYRRYDNGSLGRFMVDPTSARTETALDKRLGNVTDPTRAMERIASGSTRPSRISKRSSRVMNMLEHYARVELDPAVKKLAKQLMFVMKKRGLDVDDVALTIKFYPEDTLNGAKGTFSQTIGGPVGRVGDIHIRKAGFNPFTVMHEITHALTVQSIFANKPSANTQQLANLTEFLAGQDFGAIERDPEFGPEAAASLRVIARIYEDAAGGHMAQRKAMSEVITYGLVKGDLQRWMQRTRYTGGQVKGPRPKTVWLSFIQTMKRLAGLDAVPNDTFSEFMDITARLLKEVERAPEPITGIKRIRLDDEATIDDQNADPARAAAAQRASDQRDSALQSRRKNATDIADRRVADDAKKKEVEKLRLAPEVAVLNAERAVTHVPPMERGVTRARQENLTRIDSVGRGVFDALSGILGGNKDYETMAATALSRTGGAITDWAAQGDTPAQVAVGKVLAGVIDKYGAPQEWLIRLGSIKAGIHKASQKAVEAYEVLSTASPETQQAILDYIEYRNEGALLSAFDENSQAQATMVKSVVASLEDLRTQLTARGMVDSKMVDAPLYEWLNITGRTKFALRKHQTVGMVTASAQQLRANNIIRTGIPESDIYTKAGVSTPSHYSGKRYLPALRLNGVGSNIEVYVEEGISKATLAKLGVALDAQNTRPLTHRNGVNGVIELGRSKTRDERMSGKNAAEVVPSLLTTVFNLNKKLTYAQVVEEMVHSDGDAYIDTKYPVDDDLAPVREDKVIDLDSTNVSRKQALKRARIPGTWVKIPDNESTRTQWGELAGKYVAGPVYASLEDFHEETRIIDSDAYHDVVRVWKKYKTVWSPVTHAQNVTGNFILMYMHDIPMSNVKLAFRIIFKEAFPQAAGKMGIQLTEQELALGREFNLSGSTLGNYKEADFDSDTMLSVNKWLGDKKDSASSRDGFAGMMDLEGIMSKMTKGYTALDENFMDAYSNQDNVFRLAAYMTYLQARMGPNGEVSIEDKEGAAQHASKSFVDYDISAPWIRNMRGSVTPFIAWTYRMVPLMTKLILTKPWKAMAMLGTVHAMNALMYATMGMDGDDEDRERGVLDDYMDTSVWGIPNVPTYVRMPFGDSDNPVFLNLGGMVPLAGLFETQSAGVPRVASFSGPAMIAFQAMSNSDSFFGTTIRDETDTGGKQLQDTAEFIMRGMAPNIAASGAKIADKHFMGGGLNSPLGNEPALWVDMARGVFGLNIREVNLPDQEYKKSFAVKRIKRDFASSRNQRIRNELRRGTPDYYELDQFLLDNQERMLEALNEEFE